MSIVNERVWFCGPPPVITWKMTKTWKEEIIVSVQTSSSVG